MEWVKVLLLDSSFEIVMGKVTIDRQIDKIEDDKIIVG